MVEPAGGSLTMEGSENRAVDRYCFRLGRHIIFISGGNMKRA